ncbi:M48 family metallopeptidase [Hujiaoplasma nucleasis]|uniref:M48 family metallopeptidase n=1 Tax=Hujiaoplasma nucleasis TaxID=2725268 RepID=A0A7L6N219_9MOLU|nr:M48 family metallopeptidase [Hujiaoplasma nucleasis]QLY40213.1 M48 family metallopeptidase [Hujiaoplasma nucleasis]
MEVIIQILVYGILIFLFVFELVLSILNYKNRNAKIPESVIDVYEEEEYKKYQAYTMANFKFSLFVKGFDLLLIIILLVSGFFHWIHKIAHQISDNYYLSVLLFLFFYFLLSFISGLVISYIKTFKIEESYGFNKMTLRTFILDKIKSLILTLVLGSALLYGLLAIHQNTGSMFFVYSWIGLTIIIVLMNLIYTSLIVPIFNKLKPLEDGSLKDKIETFAQSVGYQIDKISVMDASRRSSKLNAFFSGFGKSKRIVLFDTLIDKMTEDQIVAVLAHEIGHNKHKHIIFNLFQTVLMLSIYILVLSLFLNQAIFSQAFGFENINLGFNLILYVIILSPILSLISIFTAFISRKFEYQADAFVKNNGSSEDLIQALKVLARENYSNLTPHPYYVKIFYSHPPIANRIDALK